MTLAVGLALVVVGGGVAISTGAEVEAGAASDEVATAGGADAP